jgi:hypothetical protein
MKRLCAIALLFLFSASLGCGPKAPDQNLVSYGHQHPVYEAYRHAESIGGKSYVTRGVSMEPLIVDGDGLVVDTKVPFKKCEEGDVLTYNAVWLPAGSNPVTHRLSAWYWNRSAAVMDGINNKYYEQKEQALEESNYIGKVVKIYTARPKP